MATEQELLIRINGTAKSFTDEIDKAKAKTKDLEKSLKTVAKVSTAAFIGLSAAVAGTVARFSAFEKEFSNVVTLLNKGSFSTKSFEKGVKDLESGILALRSSSGESFDTLNKGLFDIISATGDAENAMSVLETATRLAIAGGTDVSVAVDGITTAINAFGLETSQAQEVAEKFFQAQVGGKTTVEELSSSLGVAASTAAAYNVSLDELLAASSAATLAGIKTNATFTGLKAAFASISKPTEDAAKEAARLGISFNTAALRSQGLEGFLKTLTSANGFTQSSIEKLFGSVEAQNILFALTGAQAGAFSNQIEILGNQQDSAATFTDAYNVKLETTDQALQRAKGALDSFAVTIGAQFAPAINAGANALATIATNFVELDDSTKKGVAGFIAFITGLTGVIATVSLLTLGYLKLKRALIAVDTQLGISGKAQKIYNVTLALGTRALQFFRTGMILATTTVRGFAAATGIGLVLVALSLLVSNFKVVKAAVLGTFAAAKVIVQNASKAMSKAIDDFVNSPTAKALGEFLDPFIEGFKSTVGFVKDIFTSVGTVISDFVSRGVDLLGGFGDVLRGAFTFSVEAVKSGLDSVGKAIEAGFGDIGKGAGTAFADAYNESIKNSNLADGTTPTTPEETGTGGGNADEIAAQAKAESEARLEAKREENEKLLALEDEKNAAEAEKKAIKEAQELERIERQFENRQALEAELQALTDEQRALLDEKDLEQFRNVALTKENISRDLATNELRANVKRREQFLKDEIQHGTAVAKLNQFFASQEIGQAKDTANQLVSLTNSKNATVKAIGKAASLTQIGIKTAEGAISAYSSLAGIPFVGPALGAAAAAAVIAYGAEQGSAVLSAKGGGIVPAGLGGSRDRVNMMLEPGELVVPKDLAPNFIQSVGRPDSAPAGGSGGAMEVVIGFKDDAFEMIEEKLIERRRIDGVGLGALG